MDNGGSNNRGFVCGHGDDLACSSPSHHQQALKSLWAPAHRPPFHDPSSSPPKAYFDMPAPLHRNTRRRPRGRPLIHNINEEYIEVVPDETNTDPEPDCSYDEPITSQVLSGKKRRLTAEQVQFLERSFEVEKKVDPERKTRLARELGLEPRQVAIWFQNRRARYKTKSIEREFDGLRNRYDKLKGEYETVLKEKENLQDQVSALTAKLKLSKTSDSAPSPLTTYTNTDASTHHTPVVSVKTAEVKQEEAASSAKSDVLDSDSSPPRCSDGGGAAAKCNYYHYYYNSSSPVPEMVEEEESEEYQLTRSLFPPAPPPAPYDGFHRQDGGCDGFGMSAGVDVEVEPRPSSLWPWFY